MSNDDLASEAKLKAQFVLPPDDDGFSDRVMQRLPNRRHRRNWPLLTGFGMGVVSCGLAVFGGSIVPAGDGVPISWAVQLLMMAFISALSFIWIFTEETEGRGQVPRGRSRG